VTGVLNDVINDLLRIDSAVPKLNRR
jgi:hypothetical protein